MNWLADSSEPAVAGRLCRQSVRTARHTMGRMLPTIHASPGHAASIAACDYPQCPDAISYMPVVSGAWSLSGSMAGSLTDWLCRISMLSDRTVAGARDSTLLASITTHPVAHTVTRTRAAINRFLLMLFPSHRTIRAAKPVEYDNNPSGPRQMPIHRLRRNPSLQRGRATANRWRMDAGTLNSSPVRELGCYRYAPHGQRGRSSFPWHGTHNLRKFSHLLIVAAYSISRAKESFAR